MNLSNTISQTAFYLGDKKALVFGTTDYTYRELNDRVNRIAAAFKDRGVSKGDRIGIYLTNRPEWIMAYYGIIRIGAAAVCISAAYRSTELGHLIQDSQASFIVTSEELLPNIPDQNKFPFLKEIMVLEKDDVFLSLIEKKDIVQDPIQPVDCDPDDMCILLYTGGTTGVPKGAVLTHQNILYTAQSVCYHERTAPEDAHLCFMPLNHVFAGCHIMNSCFYAGATLVLHPGFDMDGIIRSIRTNKVTRLYAVPTVYIRFLNNPECHKDLASVGYSFSAATSMPSEIVRQWNETFGLKIHEAYGMTETSSLVTFNHMYKHKIGAVGTPANVVEVKIVNEEGQGVPQGQVGEIIIRGPNIMKEYFNRPDETSQTIINGWLHSGDVGRLDEEGYLFIVDRIKDLIISGGLNIYPTEVEEVLYTHDAVEECGVVGTPHEEYGEAVTAFITLKKEKKATEEELIRFCKSKMASYKAPKKIYFLKELPKTPQGKILKRELRKQ
jgi:long-chain acyl-CoA synthetase